MMRLTVAVLAATLTACMNMPPSTTKDAGNGVGPYRGLRALPRQLAFTCVTPGCDTTLTVKVESTVNRRIAIKRVILSSASAEYTITPSQAAPFILGAASNFSFDVRFAPTTAPAADDLSVLVTYTDASPDSSDPDRLEPAELSVPMVRRLVGEPALDVSPGKLVFGVVDAGGSKALPVTARNVGFGNISLAVDVADSGSPLVAVQLPAMSALTPDASVAVGVQFNPREVGYYRGDVTVGSSTPGVGAVTFEVEGTSFAQGVLVVEPEERAIDFGEVPLGMRRSVTVNLANIGGQDVAVSNVSVRDPSNNLRATLAGGSTALTLGSLQRTPITLALDSSDAGVLDAALVVMSNDLARPMLEVPIRGTVTRPQIAVSPAMLAWGSTPLGWTVVKQLELRNAGVGPLTITRITFVGGTSNLYSIRNAPALPLRLPTAGRLTLEVEFRADAMSMFNGSLSVESDDPTQRIVEVPLSATGASCSAGCMVANATPSCMNGMCSIDMCNAGFFNTDAMASNGCECAETGADPSNFCSMGEYKGNLKDTSGQTAQHTGMIPTPDDADWVRFHAEDATNFFSDDFDVRINLTSTDPDIVMCVSTHKNTAHDTSCYMEAEQCGIKTYRKDGSIGSEDGADFDIKVYRTTNSAPQCVQYTLNMSNG